MANPHTYTTTALTYYEDDGEKVKSRRHVMVRAYTRNDGVKFVDHHSFPSADEALAYKAALA